MKIEVQISDCRHIPKSYYNNNWYYLPFTIEGCNVIHEEYDGAEELEEYSIGVMEDGEYIAKYYMWVDDILCDSFIIDTNELNLKNIYT